jgi:hypothetical protein
LIVWANITGQAYTGNLVTHIVPVDDLRPHELTSMCWCHPHLDREDWIATHRSADCREDFESGRRMPS